MLDHFPLAGFGVAGPLDPSEHREPSGTPSPPAFSEVVEKLLASDPLGVAGLYRLFYRNARFLLSRHLALDAVDDAVHAVLDGAVQQIRGGGCTPDHLPQIVLSFLREQIRSNRGRAITRPEAGELDAMRRVLARLPSSHREALVGYYVGGETETDVCAALGITTAQFRRIKAEAKAGFETQRAARGAATVSDVGAAGRSLADRDAPRRILCRPPS
jgi:DNA-directed RNA polymerase specialized sigma24 family protein